MNGLVDTTVLYEAMDILGSRRLRRSIRKGFRCLKKDLEQLSALDATANAGFWANRVHLACGPCAVFGAAALTDAMRELEEELRNDRLQHVPKISRLVSQLAISTESELNRLTKVSFF
ncbi:hypothetical protein [Neptunicoccus cionae]|uniref:HPt domain-containing protein n=1 Tax=Neptunicoccus cionae TaxID=2035344 RepID=A0A916R285_9RHOB|nr:hypothetical protein [Amylibacter cionae]GGA28512.1 hypothetical protein GCM10011498_32030 [Amylibacter cionae]